MDDGKIIALLNERSEAGLAALKQKYERLILKVLRGILNSPEDAEECANDVLLDVWNKIPPDKPENLTAYVCKIARRRSIDRYRRNTAECRNEALLTELSECIPSEITVEENSGEELSRLLSEWLNELSKRSRRLFTLRYFFGESVKSAARECKMSETAASSALLRLRGKLKIFLTERGYFDE